MRWSDADNFVAKISPPAARLRREAEAIYVMREAVAEFANPVMLYSISKDWSAMLHVA